MHATVRLAPLWQSLEFMEAVFDMCDSMLAAFRYVVACRLL